MKKGAFAFFFVPLVSSISWAEEPLKLPPAFRGDKIVINKGQEQAAGWVASDGQGNFHVEIGPTADRRQIITFNYKKKKAWIMMVPGKYTEKDMDLDEMMKNVPKDIKKDCGPGEVLEGHPTKKCSYQGEYFGKKTTMTSWQAIDLNELALKSVNQDNSGMRMTNIRLGPQPAELFEDPKGQKLSDDQAAMEMLTGGGAMGKGMDPAKLQEFMKAAQQQQKR